MVRRHWLDRRRFLGSLAAGAAAPTPGIAQSRPPSIVLVMTDDQGYGDLGCHGNDQIKTPHIDALARQSVEFSQFCVSPVCAPTRASLMTGRYNYRTGVVDTYLGRAMMHGEETTLAEVLSRADYRTGIFGKWHLGDNYPLRAMDQGFQETLVHRGGGIGQPADPPGNTYFDPVLLGNGKDVRAKGYCTDIFFQAAIDFIESNKERPFFVYLPTNAPHTPLQVAEDLVAPYRQMGLDDTTAKIYAMVTNIDDNMGKLLDRLRQWRLEDNTIVIFLTDNGPQQDRYTSGLRNRKGTVYDGGIHVPFFLRWPAVAAKGGKVDRIAAHIDVFPTLLDACGVAMPSGLKVDGRNLMPLIRGESGQWPDRTLFFQWHRGDVPEMGRACAARTQKYKLVQPLGNQEGASPRNPQWELYDMEADPGETRDIAGQKPDVAARLRKAYQAWYNDVSATRGYDPPRIYLGAPQENPVILTRQDWRGPHATWSRDGLGHWEVDVRRRGAYRVTLRLDEAPQAGEAEFRLGDVTAIKPVAKTAVSVTFDSVPLPRGPARLEALLRYGNDTVGVNYVDVRALS